MQEEMIIYKLEAPEIRSLIRKKEIRWAGNKNLKIYGKLNCRSGLRMKQEHRVFFKSEEGAVASGFRPCGHCMSKAYKKWKNETV